MKSILKFVVAFIFLSGNCVFAQTQEEIINKHIEAIGGRDAWAKLNSLRMEASMKMQGAEIKITFLQLNNKAMRQNINVMGMDGYQIMTQKEGWTFMPFQGQTKPEPMTADDVKNGQDDLNLQEDFLSYKDQGKKIEYLGKDDMDGTECFKLKMTDKDGKETSYFLDASSYLTLKQSTKFTADGKEMEVATLFSNYKKLPEGIVYPMSVSGGWGDTEFTKVEVNVPIDEKEFQLPQ
jgi:hypothetical protein